MHAAPPTGARAPHPCTRCPGSHLRWRLRFPVSAATADVALGPRGPWRRQTGPSPSSEPARTSSRSGLAERTETRGPRQAWGGPAGARQAAPGLAASAPAGGFTRESQLETRTLPRVARPGGRGRCWWAWVGVGSGAGGQGVATGPAVCGALNVQSQGAAETPVFGSAQSHWQLRAQAAWRPRAPRSPPLLATGPCHSALTPRTQPAGAARALGPCVTQAGVWRGPCVVGKPAGEAGGALTSQRMTGPAGVTRCQQAALVLRRGRRLPPPPPRPPSGEGKAPGVGLGSGGGGPALQEPIPTVAGEVQQAGSGRRSQGWAAGPECTAGVGAEKQAGLAPGVRRLKGVLSREGADATPSRPGPLPAPPAPRPPSS